MQAKRQNDVDAAGDDRLMRITAFFCAVSDMSGPKDQDQSDTDHREPGRAADEVLDFPHERSTLAVGRGGHRTAKQ